jgi:hypothetical protein
VPAGSGTADLPVLAARQLDQSGTLQILMGCELRNSFFHITMPDGGERKRTAAICVGVCDFFEQDRSNTKEFTC